MIKVEHIEVYNFEGAIRGMRNPLNSWDKSDSDFSDLGCDKCNMKCIDAKYCGDGVCVQVGKNDLELMQKLFKAGAEHRKFMRQIFVSMDITAPLYWWKEFDTYKVGTTANSCSTMHTIHKKEFELADFSCEHLVAYAKANLQKTIEVLNYYRDLYNNGDELDPVCEEPTTRLQVHCMTKKDAWWQMIQILPTSYNQKRTITMTYENAASMIGQRDNHKIFEWREFVEILKGLPYMKEITEKGE